MSINVCLEKGGYAIFLTPMGGGVMLFYHLGIGGVNFFFLLQGAVCHHHHPPPAEIYEQSLSMAWYEDCKRFCKSLSRDISWCVSAMQFWNLWPF